MPKLQSTNDSTVTAMSEYISCLIRKGNPRMHYKICDKCINKKTCGSYKKFKSTQLDLYSLAKK